MWQWVSFLVMIDELDDCGKWLFKPGLEHGQKIEHLDTKLTDSMAPTIATVPNPLIGKIEVSGPSNIDENEELFPN